MTTNIITSDADKYSQTPKSPILLLEDHGYTLFYGTLLSCARVGDGGALETLSNGAPNWVEVESFESEPDVQEEIDMAFTTLISLDTEASLSKEYKRWCQIEGLPALSADEQNVSALNREQQIYLRNFENRWDLAQERSLSLGSRLSHSAWRSGDMKALRP